MTLVYLDTETTGLDPDRHEIWELAYAIDDGPIESGVIIHSLRNATPEALSMNGYWDRAQVVAPQSCMAVEIGLRSAIVGATIVGANPAFDAAFLKARWGITPWHYRLFDIEAFAAGVLGFATPRGLAATRLALVDMGYDIPKPDHTAHGDVKTLREVHRALGEQS